MGIFSSLFGGKYPSTKKYEAQVAAHQADYEKFNAYKSSPTLARYNELVTLTNSDDFKKRVRHLKEDKFADTEEAKLEREYNELRNSADIKSYNAFVKKGIDKKLEAALNSVNYSRFTDLESQVKTSDFRKKLDARRHEIESKYKHFASMRAAAEVKATEEYQLDAEYKKLQKSQEVRFVAKTTESDQYKNYIKLHNSERINKYNSLGNYIASEQFINYKKDLTDPKRFEKSQENQQLKELATISKDKELLWYQKQVETNAFADILRWKLTFEDNFASPKLDTNKWIVGYYYGRKLNNIIYSLDSERQAFREENVSLSNSEATIVTKPQNINGTKWTNRGFVNAQFEYTSSLINTGASFRQKYGRFDFKVRLQADKIVKHHIWMVGEKSTPQIDVLSFGTDKKHFIAGLTSKSQQTQTQVVDGATFDGNYYIVSLYWSPEKLTWSVNGVETCTIKGAIPSEPMYIVVSSNITDEGKTDGSQLSLDWVKCYTEEIQ